MAAFMNLVTTAYRRAVQPKYVPYDCTISKEGLLEEQKINLTPLSDDPVLNRIELEDLDQVVPSFNTPGYSLKSKDIIVALRYIQEMIFPDSFTFVENYSLRLGPQMTKENLKKLIQDNDKLTVIPLVEKGHVFGFFNTSHIKFLIVDNQKFYFYDSQTSSVDTHKIDGESLREIITQMFPEAEIVENKTKHQDDAHNCGVYCLIFLLRYLKEMPFDDIDRNPPEHIESAKSLFGIKIAEYLRQKQ